MNRPKRNINPPEKYGFTIPDPDDDGSDDAPETDNSDMDANADTSDEVSSSDDEEELDNDDWVDVAADVFHHQDHAFEGQAGWQIPNPPEYISDYLNVFLPDRLFESLCSWTNAKIRIAAAEALLKDENTTFKISEADVPTMKKYFGLTLCMPLVKKSSIDSYWSTAPLLATPYFASVMSRNSYKRIHKFIRFSDPHTIVPGNRNTRICQLDELVMEITRAFLPGQTLSLDESLLLHKGRLVFKMFIRTKRSRFGIKIFILCDSKGYMVAAEIYYGCATNLICNEPGVEELSKSELVVIYLLSKADLLDKWYCVTLDNWYTSLRLVEFLYARKTYVRGTVRNNRGIPPALRNADLQTFGIRCMSKGPVLAIKFADRKDVYLLTTRDDNGSVQKIRHLKGQGPVVYQKPEGIETYNHDMGGVDLTDQHLSGLTVVRKSHIWFKKVGLHYLQRLLLNAYVLYKSQKNNGISLVDFTKQAIVHFTQVESEPTRGRQLHAGAPPQPPNQLYHLPAAFPPTDKVDRPRRQCCQCKKLDVRINTYLFCNGCPDKPALCPTCFKPYHGVL